MANHGWTWANLSGEQLRKVADAERTLGADYLLAYQPGGRSTAGSGSPLNEVQPAPLSASQLECLQGLESQLQAVVIAYQKRRA